MILLMLLGAYHITNMLHVYVYYALMIPVYAYY